MEIDSNYLYKVIAPADLLLLECIINTITPLRRFILLMVAKAINFYYIDGM